MGVRDTDIFVMSEMKISLDLVPTASLLAEIVTRFETGIFYGVQPRSTDAKTPVNIESFRAWGDERKCQGLCADLVCQINRNFVTEDVPDEDL